MAYITTPEVKAKRTAIKAAFPSKDGWTFSVTGGNSSTLRVDLMKYPAGYTFPEHGEINHYHMEGSFERLGIGEKEQAILRKVYEIMAEGHWDKSDIMTDYFHCAYYYYLAVGKWNKPAEAAA